MTEDQKTVSVAERSNCEPSERSNSRQQTFLSYLRHAAKITGAFIWGQGIMQAVQVIAGLFLVRVLSVEGYAQFGLAYGFQVAVGSLMDLGFTSTIIPLVGAERENRKLVGRYVRSAKYLRDRTYWVLAPFAAIAFLGIASRHHWTSGVQIMLVLSVLLTLYSSGRVSYFSAPLLMFRRLREYYFPQTIAAFGRLLAYVAFSLAGVLNSWIAAGLMAINVTANGLIFEKKAIQYMEWPMPDDRGTNKEVLQYILPATPAIIFSAFQAQISLFLISVFGGTTDIAQIAALSRIGQLFAVLMTFNVVVIEPFIARLDQKRLLPIYLGFVVITAALSVPVVLLAFNFPMPFLWLLGRHYDNLGSAIGWVVLAACINHVAGLMWIMNRARMWVFWSGSILEIVLLLVVQISFILIVGVLTTEQAVFFSFASSFCYIATHGYVAILGFLKGPRNTSDLLKEAAE